MNKKILTDNSSEKITVQWDGERFSITATTKESPICVVSIVLNAKEMYDLIQFGGCLGEEDK